MRADIARIAALVVIVGTGALVVARGAFAPAPPAPVAAPPPPSAPVVAAAPVPDPPAASWTTVPRVVPPEEKREPNLPPRQGSMLPAEKDVFDLPDAVRGDGPLIIRRGMTRVRLADLEAVDDNLLCEGIQGGRWRCGRQALIALHRMVSGQFVSCSTTAQLGPDFVEARCWVENGVTLNEKMVMEGWAIPKPEMRERYAKAVAERCRRGNERIPGQRICGPDGAPAP
jgi:endonuclease YncB( thermonuclease family)